MKISTVKFGRWLAAAGTLAGLSLAAGGFNPTGPRIAGTIPVRFGTPETAWPGMAKVALSDAVQKALEAHPGDPASVELEREDGFLIWSVEGDQPAGRHLRDPRRCRLWRRLANRGRFG